MIRRWRRKHARRSAADQRATRALIYLAGVDDTDARIYLEARACRTKAEAEQIRDGLRHRFPRLRVVRVPDLDPDLPEPGDRWGFDQGGPPPPPVPIPREG